MARLMPFSSLQKIFEIRGPMTKPNPDPDTDGSPIEDDERKTKDRDEEKD